jgi:bifunctional UDP-N-acetylglucosamine pyrophosphorylase/glucosamine-1-phosphate N-acetyltransferase
MENLGLIILAAGKGTRLNSGKPSKIPKVLFKLASKSMIEHTLNLIEKLNPDQIVIVVGYKAEMVKKVLGNNYHYALQKEQIGTGDAVTKGLEALKKDIDTVLILNGDDSAFYRPETLKKLIWHHANSNNDLTFITAIYEDPSGLGRIIRSKSGAVLDIVEEKIATIDQKKINEINTGCYIAKVLWLNKILPKVGKSISGEYYFVDVVKLAIDAISKVDTITLNNTDEWRGVNTKEELTSANQLMLRRLK